MWVLFTFLLSSTTQVTWQEPGMRGSIWKGLFAHLLTLLLPSLTPLPSLSSPHSAPPSLHVFMANLYHSSLLSFCLCCFSSSLTLPPSLSGSLCLYSLNSPPHTLNKLYSILYPSYDWYLCERVVAAWAHRGTPSTSTRHTSGSLFLFLWNTQ